MTPVRAAVRQGRFVAAAALALALSACVTMQEQDAEPAASSDGAHAEQLYHEGDLDQAAREFEALAASSGGDASAHFRLRAAEALRDAGDLDGAARALGDVKR